jgi:hypothetical protein
MTLLQLNWCFFLWVKFLQESLESEITFFLCNCLNYSIIIRFR